MKSPSIGLSSFASMNPTECGWMTVRLTMLTFETCRPGCLLTFGNGLVIYSHGMLTEIKDGASCYHKIETQ